MSFPFLRATQLEYPTAEFLVIIKPAYLPLMQLLPHPVTTLAFHKHDYPGLKGILRYVRHHSQAQNADVYFCLPPSFSSAFMGFCLRSRARVGYSGESRSLLLTHRSHPPVNCHLRQEYLQLLNVYTQRDHPHQPDFPTPQLEPLPDIGQSGEYIVVNPNSQASSRRLPLAKWQTLLDSFRNQQFFLIGSAAEIQQNEALMQRVSTVNQYLNLAGQTDVLALARLLAHSRGVITNDSGPAHLAALVGAKVAVSIGAANISHTVPTGSDAEVMVISANVSCAPCVKNECPLGTLACLEELDLDQASKNIHDLFGL